MLNRQQKRKIFFGLQRIKGMNPSMFRVLDGKIVNRLTFLDPKEVEND